LMRRYGSPQMMQSATNRTNPLRLTETFLADVAV
jgi:hypothetical protein